MNKPNKGFFKELANIEPESKEGPRFTYDKAVVQQPKAASSLDNNVQKTQFNRQTASKPKSTIVKEHQKHVVQRRVR